MTAVASTLPSTAWPGRLLIPVIAGLAVGAATSLGQTYLDGPLNALVNSVSAWLVAPFLVGMLAARTPRGAAFAGLVACVLQVVGYYATSELRGFPAGGAIVLLWLGSGLIGGPLFGAGGWWARHGAATTSSGSHALRGLGAALLPSVFLVEGIWTYAVTLGYLGTGALWIAIGLALVALLLRTPRDLRWLALTLPLGLAGEVALQAIASIPL